MTEEQIDKAVNEILDIAYTLQTTIGGSVITVAHPSVFAPLWIIDNSKENFYEYTVAIESKKDAVEIIRKFYNDGRTPQSIERELNKHMINESKALFLHFYRTIQTQ